MTADVPRARPTARNQRTLPGDWALCTTVTPNAWPRGHVLRTRLRVSGDALSGEFEYTGAPTYNEIMDACRRARIEIERTWPEWMRCLSK